MRKLCMIMRALLREKTFFFYSTRSKEKKFFFFYAYSPARRFYEYGDSSNLRARANGVFIDLVSFFPRWVAPIDWFDKITVSFGMWIMIAYYWHNKIALYFWNDEFFSSLVIIVARWLSGIGPEFKSLTFRVWLLISISFEINLQK